MRKFQRGVIFFSSRTSEQQGRGGGSPRPAEPITSCLPCLQACPPPVAANGIELMPCCHGYVGGASLYNSRKSEEEEEELSLRYRRWRVSREPDLSLMAPDLCGLG